MNGFLALIGGMLQLTVPSYALRLTRRYGAQRVGWFIVIAFMSLAMLHIFGPVNAIGGGSIPRFMPDLIFAAASGLLLIGMGHIETLFAEREQTRGNEARLNNRWETQMREKLTDLAKANEELIAEIAQRDQLLNSLQASVTQYRFLFSENPHPMWLFDPRSSQMLAANKAALHLYGFTSEQFLALTVRDLLPVASVSKFLQSVSSSNLGTVFRGNWQHYRKDGTPIDVEIVAANVNCAGSTAKLILAEDVGQRQRQEFHAREAQKMAVIARVAGGVAHHFNNILTLIHGQASRLKDETPDAKSADQLNQISVAATRLAALTRQLLTVGGDHTMHLEPLDLNGLLRNQLLTLRRLVGEGITIENAPASNLAPVVADSHLVEHILVHLVLNARDAMSGLGAVRISTATLCLDDTEIQGNPGARSGEFVRLTVSDTGCGMTPKVKAHIFEPFFSTKDAGKGTGLGLASVYGAVRQQSGWIEFTSDVGVGTEFRIFLPAAPVADVLARLKAKGTPPVIRGTILLIEPDDNARSLARCILNWSEYRVIEADCSATALLLWERQGTSVDLLITDLNLPDNVSGLDLANRLQKARPNLKVIFTSASGLAKEGSTLAISLPKPYAPQKLIQKVEAVLPPLVKQEDCELESAALRKAC